MPHNKSLQGKLSQVPANLLAARTRAGLTRIQIAKTCEVTERTIRNYEGGRANFEALVVLLRISEATGVTLGELVDGNICSPGPSGRSNSARAGPGKHSRKP